MPKNFTDGDFLSSTVLNNATVHKMTGAEIFALTTADTIPGYLVYCTASGNGFVLDNLYKMNETNTTWEVVGQEDHLHTDAGGGGSLFNVNRANMAVDFFYNNLLPTANAFHTTTGTGSGGSVTSNETNGVVCATSTTSGGYATATLAGIRISFAQASAFQLALRATSSTNFTQTRIGISAEHANETNTTGRKYGIEGCSSSGVNWLLFSSDNTTRSTLATSTAVAQATLDSYAVDNTLAAIELRYNGTLAASKTSNLPVTGSSVVTTFRMGVRNTAAELKELYMNGIRIVGTISDVNFVP